MKIASILVFSFVMIGLASFGASASGDEEEVKGTFRPETFALTDSNSISYQVLIPADYDGKTPAPLLLFLHGAGERGSDNRAQLIHGRAMMEAVAKKYGCIVVAPQCPKEKQWVEVHWGLKEHRMPVEPSDPMAAVIGALDRLAERYSIDPKRVYVMGLSMGGYGTWDAIQRYPGRFAAAVPICGGGDSHGAQIMKKTPIWAFHGDKDGAVPVDRSRQMVEALKKIDVDIKYTEYAGAGHGIWNTVFATEEMVEWLFTQELK